MRDWPIVMGGVTLIVVVVMVINLLVDISYAFLDRASALAVRRIRPKGGTSHAGN